MFGESCGILGSWFLRELPSNAPSKKLGVVTGTVQRDVEARNRYDGLTGLSAFGQGVGLDAAVEQIKRFALGAN